jgi:hypothetical protein
VEAPAARTAARLAAALLACVGAGGHLAGAAADGWFLTAIGPGRLGAAVALSSAAVAVTLAIVGAAADRRDRQRWLVGLAAAGGLALAAVSLAHGPAPGPAALAGLILAKQVQAAVELAFWVAVVDWFDARALRRLVPRFAAASGLGGVVGAAAVAPIARAGGASAVMLCGAAAFALAGLAAGFAPTVRRIGPGRSGATAAWRDGLAALAGQPLARGLAGLIAVAGAAGAIAYVALGAAAAARFDDADRLAGALGSLRLVGQLATIAVQVALAPRLLARVGVGGALTIAPVATLAASVGLVASGGLGAAAALQLTARVTDGAVEGPSEKLAQNLLPVELRGRVGGWLEGPAKRTGAVLGGLAAGAVGLAWLGGLAVAATAAWLALALRVRARLPEWALGALAQPAPPAERGDAEVVLGERAARQLVRAVAADDPARAAEVAARLHRAGGLDARPLLAELYPAAPRAAVRALAATVGPGERDARAAAALAAAPTVDDDQAEAGRRGLIGRLGRGAGPLELSDSGGPRAAVATRVARARLTADDDALVAALADALDDDEPAIATTAVAELIAEVDDRPAALPAPHLARQLARIVRRRDALPPALAADAITALGRAVAAAGDDAEARWLAADVRDLARGLVGSAPPVAAAALTLLARWPGGPAPEDLTALTEALGARDDQVRAAAEQAVRGLGAAAAVPLVHAVATGRRAARDRAAALLGELAMPTRELDRLVARELDLLDQLAARAAALAALGERRLERRLEERLGERAHGVLLLAAAQLRAPAIARAARALRSATGVGERARAVEILDATLPRTLAARLIPLLDPGPLAARLHGARQRVGPIAVDAAVTAELTGPDPLTRQLVLLALPAARRADFRGALGVAARAAVDAIAPLELLRRVTDDDEDDDVPAAVDVMLALAEVPLLARLTTPQLAALAERGQLVRLAAGATAVADGELIDALLVVVDGAVEVDGRTVARGQAVDELAAFAPRPSPRVIAATPTRLYRLPRVELDQLLDDEPGLGGALVRHLGAALRGRTS